MQRAGFQAALRFADGREAGRGAGELVAAGDRVRLVDSAGVRYAQQTAVGTLLTRAEATEWTLEWRAPREGEAVVLHVAANAANGDQSEFGDHIYTRALTLARRQGEK
jgi:nucleoside-diphosphate-sugar epimerase